MVLISPKIEGSVMTLSAPGMTDFKIEISELYKATETTSVTVWRDIADCIDCGDEAGQWFSKYVLGNESGLRLMFYPSSEPKPIIPDKDYLFEQADQSDTGTLHDETSFMLMNQSSFDDLNTRIDKPVKPLQYRPNFVVKGAKAWEENSWTWVKIGEKTIFKNVQPCIRCVSTIVDPWTGERNPKMEPLKTLKTFRFFPEIATGGPVFGVHLGLRSKGNVKVGDDVYVGE